MEQEKKIRREIANSNERRRMQSINAGFNSLRTMLPKHDGEKLSKAAILQHTAEYIDQLEQDKTRFLQEMSDLKKLLNPELLALHQKKIQENESKLFDQQPTFKRIKLEVNSALDFSNSESSDEGIQCSSSPKQEIISSNLSLCHNSQNNNIVNKKISTPLAKTCNKSAVKINSTKNNNEMNINGNNLKTNENIIESEDIDELRAELVEVRKVLDRERRLRMKLEEQVRALEAQLYPTRIKEIAHQVQLQFQTNEVNQHYQTDCETEAAVTSVMVEDEHEVVAETIEIETHSCPESPNAATLLASTQQPILSSPQHYSNTSNRNSSSIVNNTTSLHIIQDNFIENTNTVYETEKLDDSEDVMAKILTAPSNNSVNNKQNKFKNSSSKNKSLNSHKPNNLTLTNSSSNSNLFNSNNSSNVTNSLKKTAFASSTINNIKLESNHNQTNKNEKFKKVKASTPAAIALPIDVPFIYDPNSTNCSTNSNKVNLDSTLPSTTVTVQIIDANASDNYENVSTGTNNAGRNLDTIVEAIRHLEGDHLFGDIGCLDQSQPKKLTEKLDADSIKTSTNVVPIMIKQIDVVAEKLNKESSKEDKQLKTKQIRTYLAVSPDQVIRQQVIKCVSNSSRPGVIVSTNP